MNKKEYQRPYTKLVLVDTSSILAGSGVTGATGEDAPWASARRMNKPEEDVWEEENY